MPLCCLFCKTQSLPKSQVNVGLGGSAVLAMLILQIISGIVVWQFSYHRLLIVSTVFGILAAAFGLAKIFPKLVNGVGPCPCCSCFFCSVIVYIMTAMLVVVAGSLPDDPNFLLEKSSFSPAPNASHFDVNHQAPGVLAGFGAYPICNNMQWDSLKPTKGSQLTALDLLVFAQAVYFGPRKDIQEELDNATLNTELYPVTIDSIQDTGEVGRVGVFSMSNVKTRVIAIRGSSQAPDWTFNLDVWGPGVFHSFVKLGGFVLLHSNIFVHMVPLMPLFCGRIQDVSAHGTGFTVCALYFA